MASVRAIRQQLGLSQIKFAELLSVTQQAVSRWESTSRTPRIETLRRIAELGHCTVDDLLKDDE